MIYARAGKLTSTLALCVAICCSAPAALGRSGSRASLTLARGGQRGKALKLTLRAERLRYRGCPARASSAPTSAPACRPSLELSGKVAISSARMTLRAKALTALLDRRGRIARLSARGGVRLSVGKRRGRGARVVLDARRRRLELSGGAQLRCPDLGLHLRGKRISFDLDGRSLAVDDVRAELALPPRGGERAGVGKGK